MARSEVGGSALERNTHAVLLAAFGAMRREIPSLHRSDSYAAGGETRSQPHIETLTLLDVTVSPVQPYQANKDYLCPGCDGTIPPGTFHLVVVPDETPDLRRHWHHGCWHKELRRRHGAQSAQASRR